MIQTPRENMLSDAERLAIEDQYLRQGYATCPRCRDLMTIKPYNCERGLTDLIAICDTCNSFDEWERPERVYRKWTHAEAEQIHRTRNPRCPVENCGALIQVIAPDKPFRFAQCPGCNGSTRHYRVGH